MNNKRQRSLRVKAGLVMVLFLIGGLLISPAAAVADDKTEAQGLVDKAKVTFNAFMVDKKFGYLQENLQNAKGLLIFPQVLKAGFIFGGSGGTGILVVKDEKTGKWSQPVFYTIGSVTFGLQFGGQAAEVVMMARTQHAIDSLYSSGFKLGGDASIAIGPMGAGAKANVVADFISFAKTKGVYAGLNLEGSVVKVRNDLDKAYYGREVRPTDIIIKKDVSNKGSAPLRKDLKKWTEEKSH